MARPREFDMDEALDAAISTFWTQGYEATSVADLMKATGLHKGSLYKAFDDKHDLFMKSLTRYLNTHWETMQAILAEPRSPLEGVRAWLQGVAHLCCDQPIQRGCLALNTAIELGPHDAEVSALLKGHHARISFLLTGTIERGQLAGDIRTDLTGDQIAKALFVFSAGLLAASKVLSDTIDTAQMLEAALAMIASH
jgi:TetR/AcrR family transcriptional repressor of nem operon